MNNLFRFGVVLAVGVLSSAVPFGYASMIFGFPATVIAALLVTVLLHRGDLR